MAGGLKKWLKRREVMTQALTEGPLAAAREAWAANIHDPEAQTTFRELVVHHLSGGHGWPAKAMAAAQLSYHTGVKQSGGDPDARPFECGWDDIHCMAHNESPVWFAGGTEFAENYALVASATMMAEAGITDRDEREQGLQEVAPYFLGRAL